MPTPRRSDSAVPAGCVSSRAAGVHGGMGDTGIDAYAQDSVVHQFARSNLDPRDSIKFSGKGNLRGSMNHSRRVGVSSGMIGQKAGAKMAEDTPRTATSDAIDATPRSTSTTSGLGSRRKMQEQGVPAGGFCGRHLPGGGMGDCGIDEQAMQSDLVRSGRLNVNPRDMEKFGTERGSLRGQVDRGKQGKRVGVSAGLIGQSARAAYAEDTPRSSQLGRTPRSSSSHASSQAIQGNRRLADDEVPAGCVSSRQVSGGWMGDHGVDALAQSSHLHASARSNLDPRGDAAEKLDSTGGNPRASVSRGSTGTRLGRSAGLIGQFSGEAYNEAAQSPMMRSGSLQGPGSMQGSESMRRSMQGSGSMRLATARSTGSIKGQAEDVLRSARSLNSTQRQLQAVEGYRSSRRSSEAADLASLASSQNQSAYGTMDGRLTARSSNRRMSGAGGQPEITPLGSALGGTLRTNSEGTFTAHALREHLASSKGSRSTTTLGSTAWIDERTS